MDNVLVSFMQDVAQGVFGDADLTYKEIHDFMDCATQADKKLVLQFHQEWNELENEEINTADLTTHVKKTIAESLVV